MNCIMNLLCLILLVGTFSPSVIRQLSAETVASDSSDESATESTGKSDTNDQEECNCTPFFKCKSFVAKTDGDNLIDIRVNMAPPCKSYMDVCCKEVNEEHSPLTGTEVPDTENPTTTPKCDCEKNGEKKYQKIEKPTTTEETTTTMTTTTEKYEKHVEAKCGNWNKDGVGFRIMNVDDETKYGEYPSMVALFEEDPEKPEKTFDKVLCGGSLIEKNVVLTAAHCVAKKNKLSIIVRAGDWDLKSESELYSHQERRAIKIISHPDYYAAGLYSDVALIFMETPFSLQDNIQTICLPKEDEVFTDKRCFSSGWGKTVSHNNYTIYEKSKTKKVEKIGTYEVSILKKVDVPMVPREKCIEALRTTRLGPKFMLHDSFICAGGEKGKDTCKGDGGGPLMCPSYEDPNVLVQAGIVAWGIQCGLADIPAAYVNVAHFRKWIDEELETFKSTMSDIK